MSQAVRFPKRISAVGARMHVLAFDPYYTRTPLRGVLGYVESRSKATHAQLAPQLMPTGVLVTVPLPAPALLTVSVNGWSENVAVTVAAAVTVTAHVPVPVHPPPLQPVKVDPAAGVAVSVTAVPLG